MYTGRDAALGAAARGGGPSAHHFCAPSGVTGSAISLGLHELPGSGSGSGGLNGPWDGVGMGAGLYIVYMGRQGKIQWK